MNDSEAACFGAEALEYHCSVCDLVRLAVRPVNSDFDIFIIGRAEALPILCVSDFCERERERERERRL